MGRAVQGHYRLAGSRRTRNSRRAGIASFNQRELGRMEKDRPLFPRKVERTLQFLNIGQDAEPPLRVGVREGIGFDRRRQRRFGLLSDRELQERFLRLLRQVRDDIEESVLGCGAHIVDPLCGNAESHQFKLAEVIEELWLRRRSPGRLGFRHALRPDDVDFLNALTNLDKLHRAGGRMTLDLASLCPFIGVVVMIDISEEQARLRPMNDEPDIGVDAH